MWKCGNLVLAATLFAATASAQVTRLEITSREPMSNGQAAGAAGPPEPPGWPAASGTLACIRTPASGGSKLTLALPLAGLGVNVITTDLKLTSSASGAAL